MSRIERYAASSMRHRRLLVSLSAALALSGCVATDSTFRNPIPVTVSAQAQDFLRGLPDPATYPRLPAADDLDAWRRLRAEESNRAEAKVSATLARYSPSIEARRYEGVPVLDVKPNGWREGRRVVVFVHGGGYVFGSARTSLPASVPLATEAALRFICVDYTTIPFATYDAILGQIILVVKSLIAAGHRMEDIALFGISAGGGLAAGAALKMRDDGLGIPAALVLWSPSTDLAVQGETFMTLRQFEPAFNYQEVEKLSQFVVPADRLRDPYVSPVYGDYARGFAPTLIQGGTREILLSNFIRLYQAMDTAGIPVKLDLYEGMVHAFPEIAPDLPESGVARAKTARFLLDHLLR